MQYITGSCVVLFLAGLYCCLPTCGVLSLVLVIVWIVCAALTAVFTTKYSNYTSPVSVYNWAYLATGAAIDACFYDRASLNFAPWPPADLYSYNLSVCTVECQSGFPPQSELLISNHVCCENNNQQIGPDDYMVYFAKLKEGSVNNALNVGLYLLRGSTIVIRPYLSDLSVQLSLYLFSNNTACDNLLTAGPKGKPDQRYLVTSYSFSNDTGEPFTKTVKQDSFYCALWRVELSTNASLTLNYTSYVNRTSFNVDLYQKNGQCKSYTGNNHPPDITPVHLRSEGNVYVCSGSSICLIVNLGGHQAVIDTTVIPSSFPNRRSIQPFTVGLILSLIVVVCIVIVIVGWHCCYKHRKPTIQPTQ